MEAATLTAGMQIGGSILGLTGSYAEAKALDKKATYIRQVGEVQAQQLERNAGQVRAAGQRAAHEERRQGEVAQSKLLAVAAASGASAGDPTVEVISGRIGEESAYRAGVAMYVSESQAKDMEYQAALTRSGAIANEEFLRFESDMTILSGWTSFLGGSVKPAVSLYEKYWPTPTTTTPKPMDYNLGTWT